MRFYFALLAFAFANVSSTFTFADGSDLLDNLSVITADLGANDVVYDQVRDVLYASIPSAAGLPNGNSIVTLDAETLEVLDRVQIGSEPNQLAISSDGSRIYVGIDGALAIRYYEPETGVIGPLQTLHDSSIAEDLQVAPDDPTTVIVSSDEVGSSAAGFLEVFNDSGQVDTVPEVYGSNSISFLDNRQLFGYQHYTSGFDSYRFSFDGTNLTEEEERGGVISGYRVTVEASGGLVFATNGQVMDPQTMTLVGRFVGASGAIEPTERDGFVYFLNGTELKAFDVDSFLEIDSATLPVGNSSTRTLEYAGVGRLAYVDSSGNVGVISGVLISDKPTYRMVVRGSEDDDVIVFDAATRKMNINGVVSKIPYEVTRLFFNGRGGNDSLLFISDDKVDEYAVLQNGSLVVDSGRVFFSAFNTEMIRFEADEMSNDISVVFDSANDETVYVRPNKLSMNTADGSIETNNRGQSIVYSSGGGDRAVLRGGNGSESVRAKFGPKQVSMSGLDKSTLLNGFGDVYINAGLGDDDRAVVFDSPDKQFFYSFGDFNVLFDNDGNTYKFKGFDFLSVASSGGDDIAYLQKTETSETRGNSRWSSIYDTFFNNNVYNFSRVDIRD